jgi:hypothetical protein
MAIRSLVFPSCVFWAPLVFAFMCSCGRSAPKQEAVESIARVKPEEMNAPLRTFSQQITSSVKSLQLKPSESTAVPITIRNTGPEPLASAGKYPIAVSYKWFEGEKMLPIEGERTVLPTVLRPDESTNLKLKIVAPSSGKSLTLKVTLVQEGVQWFLMAGAPGLDLPVTLVP